MRKLLLLMLLPLMPMPAIAGDRMWHGPGDGEVRTYLEVKEKTKDVVVLESSMIMGSKEWKGARHKVIIDCPNKTLIADYKSHQVVWKADGNLWYTDSFKHRDRMYSSSISVDYNFGCLGELPEDGHYF